MCRNMDLHDNTFLNLKRDSYSGNGAARDGSVHVATQLHASSDLSSPATFSSSETKTTQIDGFDRSGSLEGYNRVTSEQKINAIDSGENEIDCGRLTSKTDRVIETHFPSPEDVESGKTAIGWVLRSVRKIKNCKKEAVYYFCPNCHCVEYRPKTCGLRFCKKCEEQRRARIRSRLDRQIMELQRDGLFVDPRKIFMLTLTWAEHREFSKANKRKLDTYSKKFYRMARDAGYDVVGLRAPECVYKREDGLFYYHVHHLLYGKYIPQAEVSKIWAGVSGSKIVDVRRKSLLYGLRYVTKSASSPLKMFGVPLEAVAETYLRGGRFIQFYGFVGIESVHVEKTTTNPVVCSVCGTKMIPFGEFSVADMAVVVVGLMWLPSVSHRDVLI